MSDTLQQDQPSVFPPAAPTTMAGVIPSYLYQQYSDDDNLHAFVNAYNVMAQWFVDWFNGINLAYYPGLRGDMLDWVAGGLYGVHRPSLSMPTIVEIGGYNTAPYNSLAYDEASTVVTTTYCPVNDDVFCRMITWHVYKGDGYQYSTRWLKRRVHRYLNGDYGTPADDDVTFDVSVIHSGTKVTIGVLNSYVAETLQYAIADGVLALPLQYQYEVVYRQFMSPIYRDGAVINGVGQLRATAELLKVKLAGARINGVGTVSATPLGKTGYAQINGIGTLRTIDLNIRVRGAVTARLLGTGGVRASALRLQRAAAQIGGVGGFVAQLTMFTVVDGALTLVQAEPTWPTAPTGLPAGSVYRGGPNGLTVMVVPGVLPNPSAPPLFYSTTTPAQLLATGGGNLPLANPSTLDQLWNQGGTVAVAGQALVAATARISGAGSVQATVGQGTLTATARISGSGALRATRQATITASARISGSGSVRAFT